MPVIIFSKVTGISYNLKTNNNKIRKRKLHDKNYKEGELKRVMKDKLISVVIILRSLSGNSRSTAKSLRNRNLLISFPVHS